MATTYKLVLLTSIVTTSTSLVPGEEITVGNDEAWQLVNESATREIELLEAEMVESITSSYTRCPTARSFSSSSKENSLLQMTVDFGTDGPLKVDLDEQDGQWLLQGSQWLGRRVRQVDGRSDAPQRVP